MNSLILFHSIFFSLSWEKEIVVWQTRPQLYSHYKSNHWLRRKYVVVSSPYNAVGKTRGNSLVGLLGLLGLLYTKQLFYRIFGLLVVVESYPYFKVAFLCYSTI